MAYVVHSPVREFRGFRSAIAGIGGGAVFLKSALFALAAAAAILALSEIGGVESEGAAAAKADRLAAPQTLTAASSAGFEVDAQARTTTVERGASFPLSPDSPFRQGR